MLFAYLMLTQRSMFNVNSTIYSSHDSIILATLHEATFASIVFTIRESDAYFTVSEYDTDGRDMHTHTQSTAHNHATLKPHSHCPTLRPI